MTIEFTVPGVPVAKARARVTKTGHAYTPAKTKDYEVLVAMSCKTAMAEKRQVTLTGPVRLSVTAYMPIPRSLPVKRQAAMQGRSHVFRPDASNVLKSIEDGINGIAYADDKQIAELYARKVYGREPAVLVRVEELG